MPVTISTRKEDVLDYIAKPMARKLSEEIENNIVNDIASSEMTCKTGYYRVSVYYAVELKIYHKFMKEVFNVYKEIKSLRFADKQLEGGAAQHRHHRLGKRRFRERALDCIATHANENASFRFLVGVAAVDPYTARSGNVTIEKQRQLALELR